MDNKKTILITGAAGMIAWHTIHQIHKHHPDYNIIGIDNYNQDDREQFFSERINSLLSLDNFQIQFENLSREFSLSKILDNNNISCIIHLAAYAGVSDSFNYPHKILHNNYTSFINVLEEVRIHAPHIPILYASTSSVYGKQIKAKTSETSTLTPISSYGYSKVQNEQIAQLYSSQYNLKLTGLRFFTAYGEYNRKDMFIYKVLESIINSSPVTVYNNGNMQRDFTYCGDISNILMQLAIIMEHQEKGSHQIFNIGSGDPIPTIDIINKIQDLFNKKGNIILIPEYPSYDPLVTYCDNTKICDFLGKFEFTNIDTGLEKTVSWFKKINNIE